MHTDEISTNLAQVAYSLANTSNSGNEQQKSISIDAQILASLTPDEVTALKNFLSAKHSMDKLLSTGDYPPVENDWWII